MVTLRGSEIVPKAYKRQVLTFSGWDGIYMRQSRAVL